MYQVMIWFATLVLKFCNYFKSMFRFHEGPDSPQQSSHAVESGQGSEKSHATHSAKCKWYLDRANECMERAQEMTSESVPTKKKDESQSV